MRWKGNVYHLGHYLITEQCFVDTVASTGLTILGFYYCSLRREDGVIEGGSWVNFANIDNIGLYWDPSSVPFQKLSLKPVSSKRLGNPGRRCFPVYSFR